MENVSANIIEKSGLSQNKYKQYIVLGIISVIVFGIIGYFIYKKFKKTGDKVDCQLSGWEYSDCICDSGSSNGYVYKTQSIIKEAENGGIACPSSDQLRQVVKQCNCSIPIPSVTPTPTPSCVYNDNNWINVGGCSKECDGGKQGQMLQGTPSNCKQYRSVPCNTQSCPPNIPDDIYKEWYSDSEDGISVVFNRNNSVVIQNCMTNMFNCSSSPKSANGSITGTSGNTVSVSWKYDSNIGINSFTYVNSSQITDNMGNTYRPRW